jgi:hypothetical protein
MPLRRLLSGALLIVAVLALCAFVPATAIAAPLQAVPSAGGAVVQPAQTATEDAAGAPQAALDAVTAPYRPVASPADPSGEGPIARTVDPIARGAAASVPSSGAPGPQHQLHEPAEAGMSRIAASASAVRSGGRAEREQGSGVIAGSTPSPRRSVTTHGRAQQSSSPATVAEEATPGPSAPAPEPGSGPTAGVDGSSGSTGFFFGGGFALLVASLLLAGPRLRRGLFTLPAVCRPAAFLVVLERPG